MYYVKIIRAVEDKLPDDVRDAAVRERISRQSNLSDGEEELLDRLGACRDVVVAARRLEAAHHAKIIVLNADQRIRLAGVT